MRQSLTFVRRYVYGSSIVAYVKVFSPLRMSIILYVHGVCPQVCLGLHSLYMKRSDTGFCLLLLLTLFFETRSLSEHEASYFG